MLRNITVIIGLVILCLQGISQGSWKEGYVISQRADTLHGLLENNDINANVQYCNFRLTMDEPVTRYIPSTIRGYRFIDGKFFVTKRIDDPEFERPVFMEYLIQGQANIYRYINQRFFIETVDGINELKNSEELVEYEGDKYVNLKREYILLLNYFMREANMNSQIQNVRFTSKSLINIAKKYHERVCQDEACIIYEKSVSNKLWRFRLAGGLSFANYNFGLISDTNLGSGGFGGIGVELRRFSPWVEKFSVSLDLLLSRHGSFNIRSINDDIGVPITYQEEYFVLSHSPTASFIGNSDLSAPVVTEVDVIINPVTMKFPILINFYLTKSVLAPYVGLGGILVFELNQSEDFTYHYYLDNLGKSVPFGNFGVAARFGLAYRLNGRKELAFEANFEQTRSSNHNRSFRLQRRVLTTGLVLSF